MIMQSMNLTCAQFQLPLNSVSWQLFRLTVLMGYPIVIWRSNQI